RGMYGVFWAFPAILMINFVAARRPARIYTAVFLVYIAAMLFIILHPQIAARAVTGLIVTTLLTNIFLGAIADLQTKLVRQSSIDPMTGALNRRAIDSILEEAIERKRRTRTPAALLIMDIDKFKSVNDEHGHAVGDHVLKEVVLLIGSRARRLDKLFRMGGEEFMLFLPDTDRPGAVILAEDLRLSISKALLVEDRTITVSIGISELEPEETIDAWIKRGDDALLYAKNNGRNQAVEGLRPIRVAGALAAYPAQEIYN
ncbi:MAG: GGDEF domain-containing protein, partial [Pyrinomonadaceae bacterium]